MKVKTLRSFNDLKEKVLRKTGEVFECSKERYEQIMATNSTLIEPVEDPEAAEPEAETPEAETPEATEPEAEAPKKTSSRKKTAKGAAAK